MMTNVFFFSFCSSPAKVFALGVYPKNSLKQKALEEALQIMSRDDPSLVVGPDPENTDELLVQVNSSTYPSSLSFLLLLLLLLLF
jgi:translation elongation factor EF-G